MREQDKDEVLEDRLLTEALVAQMSHGKGGGRLGAKLTKKSVDEVELRLPLPFEDAVVQVTRLFVEVGHTHHPERPDPDPDRLVKRVLTRAGLGGLVPVVVTAAIARGGPDSTEVWLRAVAQEGLIKHRAGRKTAARLAELLASPPPP